jgi:phosphoribosylanthranilate isomerase
MERAAKMDRVKIKICGLKRVCDIRLCHELGVDIAGLVTEYPLPVPWNLTVEETKPLLAEVRAPMKSCIVTGGTRDKILALAKDLRPDYVQLHSHETLSDAEYIAGTLRPLQIGVIKTLPFSPRERLAHFGTEDIRECTELLNATGICAILADTRAPSNAAGNGTLVDVDMYRQIKRWARNPVILAGGITPENLTQFLSAAQPDVIDIMTGVENSPGVKDREKLAFIIKHIR